MTHVFHSEYTDEDGVNDRAVHAVDHDTGGFIVSSPEVGLPLVAFLNAATLDDLWTVHQHIFAEYAKRYCEGEDV